MLIRVVFPSVYVLAPTAGPLNIQVSYTGSTSLTVKWDPPLQREIHGNIRQYSVRYRKVNCSPSSKDVNAWDFVNVKGTMTFAKITDLAASSCYGIQISAVTIRNGKWSAEIRHQTSSRGKYSISSYLRYTCHLKRHKGN